MTQMGVFYVPWDLDKESVMVKVDIGNNGQLEELVGGHVDMYGIPGYKAVMLTNVNGYASGSPINARATSFMAGQQIFERHCGYWVGNVVFVGEETVGIYTDCPIGLYVDYNTLPKRRKPPVAAPKSDILKKLADGLRRMN